MTEDRRTAWMDDELEPREPVTKSQLELLLMLNKGFGEYLEHGGELPAIVITASPLPGIEKVRGMDVIADSSLAQDSAYIMAVSDYVRLKATLI